MASLSSCLSTFGDAYEQPIFRKGDAASYEEVDILGRLMNSSEMPPHWIAYTSPRNLRYYYNKETKKTRLSKPECPNENTGHESGDDRPQPNDTPPSHAPERDETDHHVVDKSAITQSQPANSENTPRDLNVAHPAPDLETNLPSSETLASEIMAEKEKNNHSNASIGALIPAEDSRGASENKDVVSNGSDTPMEGHQTASRGTQAARVDPKTDRADAQQHNPACPKATPIISVTPSPGNTRIDLGTSTGDTFTLTDLPDIRPLTPTNGVAAEARAAIACGSEDSPHLLGLPGGNLDTSSMSGTSAVGEDDDNESVESATGRGEFSPAFRLRIHKTADGVSDVREDLVFGTDLEEFDTAAVEPGTISLCFVASNTQENSIYASKETIECILNKYGLETILGRLGACPQMVTHQVIRPIGNGDFIFTSRCATAVDASTFLCYRYRHSDKSIFGLVLDRRERSEAFIDILKTLDTKAGLPLLPALTMALFGLRVNIRTLGKLENTYYFNKMFDRVTSELVTGSKRPADFDSLLGFIFGTFNGLFSIVGSLNVSMSAVLALTRLIRETDLEKQFSDIVDAIDSETRGQIESVTRTQARTSQRQQIFTAAMQTTISLQAHDANMKQAEVLRSTREATATSTETLKTMASLQQQAQEANAKQAEVLRSTQEATAASTETLKTMVSLQQQSQEANAKQAEVLTATKEATLASTGTLSTVQELLAGTQELNRKAEEVARQAADYGILVLGITFATFLSGCLSTCAEIFQMTKSKPKLIFIPIVVIIIISIGAGAVSVRYIRSRAKKAKIVAETPSAQSKVEDASD